MTTNPPAHQISASATASPKPASRAVWFAAGLFTGIVATLCLSSAVVGLVLVSRKAQIPRAADHAQVVRLAKVIAVPLVTTEFKKGSLNDAEVLAIIAIRIQDADAIVRDGNELSPIAAEYADALREAQKVLAEAPSPQPLIRSGLDAWRGSVNDDGRQFWMGMIGVGTELSKVAELSDRMRAIHLRMVACRLRLAEAASRTAPQEANENTMEWGFLESGVGNSTVASDTVFLKNVCPTRLTGVVVVTELTGASGETFSNCYFTEKWEKGQTLLALCQSDSVARETVHHVKRVRCRVIASERMSRLVDLER